MCKQNNYRLFSLIVGCIFLSVISYNNYANTNKNAQTTQNKIPQSTPDVTLSPSNNDLKLLDKIFKNAKYDQLHYAHNDDQTDELKKFFTIPDDTSDDINDGY